MPETSRIKWPFPREFEDPWYDTFVTFIEAVDASMYTTREDRSSLLMGGGTVSFNITGFDGALSWTQAISLLSPIAGLLINFEPTTVTLLDGEMLYANVTRYPLNSLSSMLLKARSVPNTDDALLMAIRRGTRVYWRNGRVISNGESLPLFESNGGGAGASLGSATPQTVTAGAAGSAGTDPTFASRQDHSHPVPVAAPVTVSGVTNAQGASNSFARADHQHRLEVEVQSAGVGVGQRPRLNFVNGTVADNPGLDRVDVTLVALTGSAPTTIEPDDAAAPGAATAAARADHRHAIAAAAPSTVTAATNTEGASTAFARADHGHRLAVNVLQSAVPKGSRPKLNFTGAGVTVTDNGVDDELDILIPGGGGSYTLPVYLVGPGASGPLGSSPVYSSLAAAVAQFLLDGHSDANPAVIEFMPGSYAGGTVPDGAYIRGRGARPQDVIFTSTLSYAATGTRTWSLQNVAVTPPPLAVGINITGDTPQLFANDVIVDAHTGIQTNPTVGCVVWGRNIRLVMQSGGAGAVRAVGAGTVFKVDRFQLMGPVTELTVNLPNGSILATEYEQQGQAYVGAGFYMDVQRFKTWTDTLAAFKIAATAEVRAAFGIVDVTNTTYAVERNGVGDAGTWKSAAIIYPSIGAVGPQITQTPWPLDGGENRQSFAASGSIPQACTLARLTGAAPLAMALPKVGERPAARLLYLKSETTGGAATTLTPDGSDTIDGAASFVLASGEAILLAPDPVTGKWLLLGRYGQAGVPFYLVGPAGSGPGGSSPQFATIAAAKAAIPAGQSRVVVLMPGTYTENVDIDTVGMSLVAWQPHLTDIASTAPVRIVGNVTINPNAAGRRISLHNIAIEPAAGPGLVVSGANAVETDLSGLIVRAVDEAYVVSSTAAGTRTYCRNSKFISTSKDAVRTSGAAHAHDFVNLSADAGPTASAVYASDASVVTVRDAGFLLKPVRAAGAATLVVLRNISHATGSNIPYRLQSSGTISVEKVRLDSSASKMFELISGGGGFIYGDLCVSGGVPFTFDTGLAAVPLVSLPGVTYQVLTANGNISEYADYVFLINLLTTITATLPTGLNGLPRPVTIKSIAANKSGYHQYNVSGGGSIDAVGTTVQLPNLSAHTLVRGVTANVWWIVADVGTGGITGGGTSAAAYTYLPLSSRTYRSTVDDGTSILSIGAGVWHPDEHNYAGRTIRLRVVLNAALVSNNVRVQLWSVFDNAYVTDLDGSGNLYLQTSSLSPTELVSRDLNGVAADNFDESVNGRVYEVHIYSTNAATRVVASKAELVVGLP